MNHLSLALKYRPQTLAEVTGQDHVTKGLANAISTNRVRQAYLFSGIRGVGKTTMARVLAAALNCLKSDKPTIEPCLECRSCQGVHKGDDISVFEIDGASNNKVDDIRALKDEVGSYAMHGRYKIYIIDECQMLTKQAFNALLKTLEEPPSHVKFILCTTELGKIPTTIQDRCQLYRFYPITDETLAKRLNWVLVQEGGKCDDEFALELAKMAQGSLRNGLTLLDQLINTGEEILTVASLEGLFGKPARSRVAGLIMAISRGDVANVMKNLNQLTRRGFSEYFVVTTVIDALQELIQDRVSKPCKLEAVVDIILDLEGLSRVVRSSDTPKALLEASLLKTTLKRREK